MQKIIKANHNMSRVVYKDHIASMHGKVEPGANQSFRGNFTYTLQNPRTAESFTEHEKQSDASRAGRHDWLCLNIIQAQ